MHAYREDLPEDCPPPEAAIITDGTVVYRLVREPLSDADFHSWRRLKQGQDLPDGISECRARSVSVFVRLDVVERKLRNKSRFPGQKVCKLTLGASAGKIQKTGGGSHRSWWPFADYDILAACEVLP